MLTAGVVTAVTEPGDLRDDSTTASATGAPTPLLPSPTPTPLESPTSTESASPSSAPSTAIPSTPSAPGGLADVFFEPPPPYQRIRDVEARTGPLDIDAAAAIDGGGAPSKAGLQELGFVTGYSRSWETPESVLLVLAYEFRTPQGAMGYVNSARMLRVGDPAYKAQTVTTVPGAISYRTRRGTSFTQLVLFSNGTRAFVLGVVRDTDVPGSTEVAALAKQQFDAA